MSSAARLRRSSQMRFMFIVKSAHPFGPPTPQFLEAMNKLADREIKAGRLLDNGGPILMLDQNRALWDQLQIRRGMQALGRARELGGAGGIYALQAAIIACHAQARNAGDTDWSRIARLYAELAAVVRSPVIELNRAIAVSMAESPQAGLAIVEGLSGEPALK